MSKYEMFWCCLIIANIWWATSPETQTSQGHLIMGVVFVLLGLTIVLLSK